MAFNGKALDQLENFTEIQFPKVIKDILILTGFDDFYTLCMINEETLKSIENEVQEELNKSDAIIKGSIYQKFFKNKIPFKFLLGHKVAILNIPKDIERLKNSQELEKKSIEDLNIYKESLFLKIDKFIASKKYPKTFKREHIKRLSAKKNVVKCFVQCASCKREIICSFDSCLRVSNFYKHLNSHNEKKTQNTAQSNSAKNNPSATATTTDTSSDNISPIICSGILIERAGKSSADKIDQILGSLAIQNSSEASSEAL